MLYSQARPLIKSGDLLAFSHVGWGSWHDFKIQMIRVFQRTEYSHVGVAWVVGGRVFILEAVMPLVRIYPLSKLGKFFWLPTNANWSPDVEEYALSIVGDEYSQLEAVESPFTTPKKDNLWECAEFAHDVLTMAGVDFQNVSRTPCDIVRHAMENLGITNTLVTPS